MELWYANKLKYIFVLLGFFCCMLLTFCSWHFGYPPESMVGFFENAVLNVVFSSVIYGPCLWMALSLGPLRERAPWTSKEPRQLSSTPYSSAGLCWARRNLGADLVILPLWTHWNHVFTYCAWQESIFIILQAKWSCFFFYYCCYFSAKSWITLPPTLIEGNTLSLEI